MSEVATSERRFVVNVERTWKLWLIPILALLYLAWVLVLVAGHVNTGLADAVWVQLGLAIFLVLFVLEIVFLLRRKVKEPRMQAAPVAETLDEPMQAMAAMSAPVQRRAIGPAFEVRLTPDEHRGRRVLEVSLPPKSANKGSVFSKAYVELDGSYILRVEDLVATKVETM